MCVCVCVCVRARVCVRVSMFINREKCTFLKGFFPPQNCLHSQGRREKKLKESLMLLIGSLGAS